MGMFADHKGEVRSRSRHRELSPQTKEIRAALTETIATDKFKVIPGTTEAEFKSWEGKLRAQAVQLDIGVKVRLTVDTGEVAFKAHELVEAPAPPPAIVPTSPARKRVNPPAVAAPPAPVKRGPGRPRKNAGR